MSNRVIELVRLEPISVVGFRVQARWNQLFEAVPEAWAQLFRHADELRGLAEGEPKFVDVNVDVQDGVYTQLLGIKAQAAAAPCLAGMHRLHVPAGDWLHLVHTGPLAAIAEGFSALYAHAEAAGFAVNDVKLDFGYTPAGDERPHDLYLGLKSNEGPEWRKRTLEELENG